MLEDPAKLISEWMNPQTAALRQVVTSLDVIEVELWKLQRATQTRLRLIVQRPCGFIEPCLPSKVARQTMPGPTSGYRASSAATSRRLVALARRDRVRRRRSVAAWGIINAAVPRRIAPAWSQVFARQALPAKRLRRSLKNGAGR
jgi:hypothetical protein